MYYIKIRIWDRHNGLPLYYNYDLGYLELVEFLWRNISLGRDVTESKISRCSFPWWLLVYYEKNCVAFFTPGSFVHRFYGFWTCTMSEVGAKFWKRRFSSTKMYLGTPFSIKMEKFFLWEFLNKIHYSFTTIFSFEFWVQNVNFNYQFCTYILNQFSLYSIQPRRYEQSLLHLI